MLKKIKRAFGFGSCDPMEGSTIIINAEKLERRVALLENGVLEEYTIEREGEDNIVGGIFKGRVKNIEPGLKAMFVDIGQEKNAFLHFWDALPAALDSSLEEIEREGRPKKQQRKITSKDIPDIYPIGSEIMVQVTKGPIGTKGPRVTTNVSLAGRYLVLMPFTDQFGISRKIEDPKERLRLRQIMQKLNVPDGMGIEFDKNSYLWDAENPIYSRYVMCGHDTRVAARLLAENWQQVVSTEDLVIYKRP